MLLSGIKQAVLATKQSKSPKKRIIINISEKRQSLASAPNSIKNSQCKSSSKFETKSVLHFPLQENHHKQSKVTHQDESLSFSFEKDILLKGQYTERLSSHIFKEEKCQSIHGLSLFSIQDRRGCALEDQNMNIEIQTEFNKLLEITSRCFDYFAKFQEDKKIEEAVTEIAFAEVQKILQETFAPIERKIAETKIELKRLILQKKAEVWSKRNSQKQSLKERMVEIGCLQKKFSSESVKNPQLSQQLTNYANFLNRFYIQIEQIQRYKLNQHLNENIDFLTSEFHSSFQNLLNLDSFKRLSDTQPGDKLTDSSNGNISFNNECLFQMKYLRPSGQCKESQLKSLKPYTDDCEGISDVAHQADPNQSNIIPQLQIFQSQNNLNQIRLSGFEDLSSLQKHLDTGRFDLETASVRERNLGNQGNFLSNNEKSDSSEKRCVLQEIRSNQTYRKNCIQFYKQAIRDSKQI